MKRCCIYIYHKQYIKFGHPSKLNSGFLMYLDASHDSLAVVMLDRKLKVWRFKFLAGQNFVFTFWLHMRPLVNSAITSTVTTHCCGLIR